MCLKYILTIIVAFYFTSSIAQTGLQTGKPALDFKSVLIWPKLDNPCISRDGRYMACTIKGIVKDSCTILIKGILKKWERKFIVPKPIFSVTYFFSRDNRRFLYQDGLSLNYLDLQKNIITKKCFLLISNIRKKQWGNG
ncbi:hypothetical protein SAMN05216436_101246 [bacterium A37T11]|nr:hypothetical protein SAMN05216436_101246 [bacterium A37T11]